MSKTKGTLKRSVTTIQQQRAEVQQTYDKHMNLVTRVFSGKSRKKTIFFFLVVSFAFYGAAIVGVMADFKVEETTEGENGEEKVSMELTGWTFSRKRLKYFTDFSNPEDESDSKYAGYGRELLFMPILILVHLIMLAAIGKSMREPFVVAPSLIDVDMKKLVKTVRRIRGNFRGLLIGLPFMIFDVYFSYQDVSDPDEVIINPLVHWIVTSSWCLQWFIFGVVLNHLVAYLFFIRHLTKGYTYEANILAIAVRRDLDPLIYLGYQLAGVLGLYLITNLTYMLAVPPPWYSDVIATLIVLLAIPIIAIGPLEMIERDLAKEQAEIRNRFFDQYVDDGIKFIADPTSVNEKALLDILMVHQLLDTFDKYKRETLKVYFRVFYVLVLAGAGILINVIYLWDILAGS
ncbi:MAG: hypothetical protein ACFFB3_11935 [Candidatus Hodarchaeota archaeon]